MKTFSWVYRNRTTDDLVLVMRPHRRSVSPRYRVLAGVFKKAGYRPDVFVCASVSSYDRAEFRSKFEYVGGLNAKGRPAKARKIGMSPVLGMEYQASSLDFADPYESLFEEMQDDI